MKLDRTVIIPTTDHSLAQKLFKSLIYDEDVLVVVVLGEDEDSTSAVQYADKRAKAVVAGYERKVAWIRNRNILETEIKQIAAGKKDISKEDLTKVIAFSVSLNNKVADIIYTGEIIDYVRIDYAFLKAGEI